MTSKWPVVRVEDVCSLIVDCVNKTAPVSAQPTPFRMIRTTNVRNGRIDLTDCKFVDEETFKIWTRRAQVRAGDVILTREAPIGEVGFVPEQEGLFLGQRLMQYRADPSKLDRRFLLYSFLSPRLQHQFGSHEGSGSVVSHIRVGDCFKFELPLPPIDIQQKIGEALGALDDKIDVNRRINQTLEAMAQAIFKSWFVDFDPVKAKIAAKAEGRDPLRAAMTAISGKPDAELDTLPPDQFAPLAATAALFPDEMEDSELGVIPRGWEVVTVGQVAEVIKGKSYSSKDLVDNTQTALVTLKSFERGGGFRMDGFKPYVGVFKPGQVVVPGELIVAYTDVTQAAELIGRPAIVVGVDRYQTLVASLDVGIVRPNPDQVSRQFLFGLFSTEAFQAHTFAHTSGTTVLHLAKEGVPSFRFAKPPIDLIKRFSSHADPVVAMKQSTLDQIAALTELRDALLPKLLSGELQVQIPELEGAA